ncbi:MAG: HAD hydrolase-like protein [Kiritimatiellae bacterium]|nr:HAD hydrolase-like protein [Kiritimatiellia bacterium]
MNAAFFDMDGTLIDSRRDLCATVNHTRRELGLPEWEMDRILANVGQGAKHLLKHCIPEKADDPDLLWEVFSAHYAEHMLETVELYPTVRKTLEELKARGWLLGVNTAKPAFATHAILEHFGLARFFGGAVVAGGDCKEMKPSPLPLRECAAKMRGHRLGAGDWMVGDSWTDMQCAANAGIKGAFCAFGFGKLGDSRYTAKINRMEELLRYLKSEDDF